MTVTSQSPLLSLLNPPGNDALSWITHAARDTIPGVDFASISVAHTGGYFETVGSTDPLALKADELQYELLEGPCLEAAFGTPVASSDDVSNDPRWLVYGGRAAELGVKAQAAFALHSGKRTLGGLNLYSTSAFSLRPTVKALGVRFAAQAASAMEVAHRLDTLTEALVARKTIGQATGIVMERFGLDEERAFQYLVRLSQTTNVKLRAVAGELVAQTSARRGAN